MCLENESGKVRENLKICQGESGNFGQLVGENFEMITKINKMLILASRVNRKIQKLFAHAFGARDLSDLFMF